MFHYKLVLGLVVLTVIQEINYSSAFTSEGLIDGFTMNTTRETPIAVIMGQLNFSKIMQKVCNGVVISKYYILSIASCVQNNDGSLRNFKFFIGLKITFLENKADRRSVKEIYFTHSNPALNHEYFSLLKVKHGLRMEMKLNLPLKNESFIGMATVYSYSHIWITGDSDNGTTHRLTDTRRRPVQLSYGYVRIVPIEECRATLPLISSQSELCGMLYPVTTQMSRNTYLGDSGSPLIIGNKLVGLVKKFVLNKNKLLIPDVYINLSNYIEIIQRILSEYGTIKLPNRSHHL